MNISVVISTYNSPRWLEKVLWGYQSQTFRDFEILIADDGSGPETREAIGLFQEEVPFPVRHIWHKDTGFRKTRILNQATVAADGEYLVFTDGDCVPRHDFLEIHARLAEDGFFLSGGYCKLPMALSETITRQEIQSGRAFDIGWLKKNGLRGRSQKFRLGLKPPWNTLVDLCTPTKATWNGCNASVWKIHLFEVNGHNQDMAYGGLDRELGERFLNLGLKSKQIRNRAICLHLDHKRDYKNQVEWDANFARRQDAIKNKIICCANGIQALPDSSTKPLAANK